MEFGDNESGARSSGYPDSQRHRRSEIRKPASGEPMNAKHPKLDKPMNTDLVRNPLIGGSKGMTMAQATPDDLEELRGDNTFEGDVENDTTPEGGLDKSPRRNASATRHADRDGPSRKPELRGEKTHEQQLRMLERKPDLPDARQLKQETTRLTSNRGPAFKK
jgi:hypothetical protein